VGRELKRRVKKRFDADGIEIPFPKLSIAEPRKSLPGATEGPESR
jgi:small-conductance mechanosensitive channel